MPISLLARQISPCGRINSLCTFVSTGASRRHRYARREKFPEEQNQFVSGCVWGEIIIISCIACTWTNLFDEGRSYQFFCRLVITFLEADVFWKQNKLGEFHETIVLSPLSSKYFVFTLFHSLEWHKDWKILRLLYMLFIPSTHRNAQLKIKHF